jgi:cytochrome c oxidase subunit 3
MTKTHSYHIVDPSPWPIATAFTLLFVALGVLAVIKEITLGLPFLIISSLLLIAVIWSWWSDVVKEALIQKQHTSVVRSGIRFGFILFIVSEIMFFGVFFGSIFKNKFLPVKGLNGDWAEKIVNWVPVSFYEMDPWNIPFTGTLVLLLSSTSLTWAHHGLEQKNKTELLEGLKYTIFLGIAFTCLQIFEYIHAPFKLADSVFTSDFYLVTGFHGAHVIIGTIFLTVCYFRAQAGHFDEGNSHLAFEFASIYWHFVDIVWLFLFVFLYLFS